jgi:hypothetical protein
VSRYEAPHGLPRRNAWDALGVPLPHTIGKGLAVIHLNDSGSKTNELIAASYASGMAVFMIALFLEAPSKEKHQTRF